MTGMPGMSRMTWKWGDQDDWYDRDEQEVWDDWVALDD